MMKIFIQTKKLILGQISPPRSFLKVVAHGST